MTVDAEVTLFDEQFERLQAESGEETYWVSWTNDNNENSMTWSCLMRCDYGPLSSALRLAEHLLGFDATVNSIERRKA